MNECSSASDQEEDSVYSKNESSDDDIYLAQAVVAATTKMCNRLRAPQPMHNSRLTYSMRGNVDVNADYVFDDGIDSTGPSTGTQQHDSSMGAMNQMRDMIADDMWEIYQSSPWYKST
ncbi:hypothetical protein TIFTF001_046968 [Ficus carica]|uniref:Uncharacterized protein n=1 Tax=Ficus carica TaxID=3494 RepID=A0AA88CV88_FICCA|nr:hypothetical protein TIFTF001_046968 [Ficus carica]